MARTFIKTVFHSWFLSAGVMLVLGLPAVPAGADPVTLAEVEVPEPRNLHRFVQDKDAAIRLGKALFWDMQLGSDGITACASCHFHAGTDNRLHNSVSPGLLQRDAADLSLGDPDTTFHTTAGPDRKLGLDDFPLFALADPENRFSAVLRDSNDVVSSQGVPFKLFERVREGQAIDAGRIIRDDVFHRNLRNVRRVEPRSTPTVINAVFNFANFWDGRANHFFNGVNPFGVMDTQARVLINTANGLSELNLTGDLTTNIYALDNASLASQAVGPPLSDFEMSWRGRTWPDIGKKMLPLRPLAKQIVHPQDSTLAGRIHPSGRGLNATYADMIRAAFRPEFWNSGETVAFSTQGDELQPATSADPRVQMQSAGDLILQSDAVRTLQAHGGEAFTQMEANFSLFFGLAVQLYQATLVSDDTPFDRFMLGDFDALTERQQRGLALFNSGAAACTECHIGPEFTGASVRFAREPDEAGLIELMAMGDGNTANYDIGFYNIGVRPTHEDVGRGDRVVFHGQELPLSFARQFMMSMNGELPFAPIAQPGCINDFVADPPTICPPPGQIAERVAVDGAFKTPGLRNVELTGPYMHNGGMATLMQVVDFYVRGGDFREANMANLDPAIIDIVGMKNAPAEKEAMVDFLLALTDERVRWEMAPFDHPQLFVTDGHLDVIPGNPKHTRVLADRMVEIPAVGRLGRQAEGLEPLKPFLADDLNGAELANFHFQQ
ncbi:cytochrome-c peroxidase [Geoalkalibacter halelectricus]|uniref:cytochrome-c peroxidase n=1 Tax=Geoalkalibacter halelectricus TaxID=2847045 RepID=UPI003D25D381